MSIEKTLISTKEAAEITGLTPQHVSNLCKCNKIAGAMRVGRAYVIPIIWAKEIAEFNKKTVSIKEAAAQADVSRIAIVQAAQNGKIVKINSRITKDSLAVYIERRTQNDK